MSKATNDLYASVVANKDWAKERLASIPTPDRERAQATSSGLGTSDEDTVWVRFVRTYEYAHLNPDHMIAGLRIGIAHSGALAAFSYWPHDLYERIMHELMLKWHDAPYVLAHVEWCLHTLQKPWSEISLIRALSFLMGSSIILRMVGERPTTQEPKHGKSHTKTPQDATAAPARARPPKRSGASVGPHALAAP